MPKAKYFEGLFIDLECGHRLWGHKDRKQLEQFRNSKTPFKEELYCPKCQVKEKSKRKLFNLADLSDPFEVRGKGRGV